MKLNTTNVLVGVAALWIVYRMAQARTAAGASNAMAANQEKAASWWTYAGSWQQ